MSPIDGDLIESLSRGDDLAREILRHYGEMDMEARSQIPLTKIYWPT